MQSFYLELRLYGCLFNNSIKYTCMFTHVPKCISYCIIKDVSEKYLLIRKSYTHILTICIFIIIHSGSQSMDIVTLLSLLHFYEALEDMFPSFIHLAAIHLSSDYQKWEGHWRSFSTIPSFQNREIKSKHKIASPKVKAQLSEKASTPTAVTWR